MMRMTYSSFRVRNSEVYSYSDAKGNHHIHTSDSRNFKNLNLLQFYVQLNILSREGLIIPKSAMEKVEFQLKNMHLCNHIQPRVYE